ncbi:MAG: enoyl-CoA hydratase/isomerase family protein [Acidimicrobiales bacterium]
MRDDPKPVDGLVVERAGGVLSLRLDRPERRNAITDDIVLALIDLIEGAGSDQSVRVVHLSGTGDHFCSGFDLSLRGDTDTKPRAGATQRQMRWHVNRLIPTMLETQTPIVTSVRGWAIGLGLNLALASDFVVAADDARLWAPFTESGFTPDSGASWLIPRLVGVARAKEMILLGEKISGARAAEWGLIHRAVPPGDVAAEAAALVDRLATSATVSVGLSKLLVHRSLTVDLARHLEDEGLALELSSRSQDFQEASRARREKRDADFTGT